MENNTDIKILLGKRIRELRTKRGLTQEKLSEIIGVDIGFRRGELTGLTWNDIDFKNSQISITQSLEIGLYTYYLHAC